MLIGYGVVFAFALSLSRNLDSRSPDVFGAGQGHVQIAGTIGVKASTDTLQLILAAFDRLEAVELRTLYPCKVSDCLMGATFLDGRWRKWLAELGRGFRPTEGQGEEDGPTGFGH